MTDIELEKLILAFFSKGIISCPDECYFSSSEAKKVAQLCEPVVLSKEYEKRSGVSQAFIFDVIEMDTFGEVSGHIKTLKDLYQRRIGIERLELQKKELLDFSKKLVSDASPKRVDSLWNAIETKMDLYGTGIDFGFPAWQSVFGLNRCEMMTIVAPSGTYKTAFAMNLMLKASQLNKGLKTVFFSFEMSEAAWADRLLQIMSGKSKKEITWTRYNDAERWAEWKRTFEADARHMSLVSTSTTIKGIADAIEDVGDVGLVAIDYVDFISVPHGNRQGDWKNELHRQIKELAKKKNVAIINLAQVEVGKLRDGGKVTMASARGGGGAMDACDVGWNMWRNESEVIGGFGKVRDVYDPTHLQSEFICVWNGMILMDLIPVKKID